MKQDDLHQASIDGAIHIIAQNKLGKATTKAKRNATSINEVYIYRLFENKGEILIYVRYYYSPCLWSES